MLFRSYLATRIPEELEHYELLVALTEAITKEAFSNAVVEPGVTTVGDVRRFMYDELWSHGVGTWFQPDMRVQRAGMADVGSRGFLAVAPEETVIEPGDLIRSEDGTRLNSSHVVISYAVFCLKKKKYLTVYTHSYLV